MDPTAFIKKTLSTTKDQQLSTLLNRCLELYDKKYTINLYL